MTGGANLMLFRLFVQARDLVIAIASTLVLGYGSYMWRRTLNKTDESGHRLPSGGLFGALFPVATFVGLAVYLHYTFNGHTEAGLNIFHAYKLLVDGSLGCIFGSAYVLYILSNCNALASSDNKSKDAIRLTTNGSSVATTKLISDYRSDVSTVVRQSLPAQQSGAYYVQPPQSREEFFRNADSSSNSTSMPLPPPPSVLPSRPFPQ